MKGRDGQGRVVEGDAGSRVHIMRPAPAPVVLFARTPGRDRKKGEPRSVPAPPAGQARLASPRGRSCLAVVQVARQAALAEGLTKVAGVRGEHDFTVIEPQPKRLVPRCVPVRRQTDHRAIANSSCSPSTRRSLWPRSKSISAGNGQLNPALASRFNVNRTVDAATPTRRAISLSPTPAVRAQGGRRASYAAGPNWWVRRRRNINCQQCVKRLTHHPGLASYWWRRSQLRPQEGSVVRLNFGAGASRGSCSTTQFEGRLAMKAVSCCATTLTLMAAIGLSPAMGQGPKPSGGRTWPGIAQPVEHDADPAHSANPSFQGASPQGTSQRGFVVMPFDPEAAKIKPHYEWQYHYTGRHAHWEGHWTLVTAPIQSAKPPTTPAP